ncbi:metalloendopeptidase [Paenibacillus sp. J31TS4]|uniref:peptidoglycan DD-metalloendopeptidase family protein n=1 Tax=Paenibacillus sp. J31TS4 TaxID=2807195 RepID=UPI001B2DE3F1|nr:peptidoglycan DD-metalloendopeptidase family protein [Paenibacillus sp. J31TS4]GIP40614.1 metalloendopeptidase [Paenibacillus sp. J31TS4]
MTVSKMKNWIRKSAGAVKTACSTIRFQSLTGRIRAILSKTKPQQTQTPQVEEPQTSYIANPATQEPDYQLPVGWMSRLKEHRYSVAKGLGAFGLVAAITIGGNQFVQSNTLELYDVYVDGEKVGTVNDPQVVEDFKLAKYKELDQEHPNVHMVLNTDDVTLSREREFKKTYDNEGALAQLDKKLVAQPVGVELVVDGKAVGILKDKDTAEKILDQIKSKYTGGKDANKVSVLSANANNEKTEVEQADFVQKVEMKPVKLVTEKEVVDPQKMAETLQTGDVTPTEYTVQKGDCVSCIATKYNISKQVIYANNPWIIDDQIKEGQKLNLTVLQPKLSVKTVEKVTEQQEVHYATEVIKDDKMKVGEVQTITPGKNGLKQVTFNVTKVNGLMMDEQLVDEKILVEPVAAVEKKGTKVVLGEGSGKFAWPVVGATLTSGFGTRWGKLHKGIDLSSGNKNILAADNGTVVAAGYKSDYGNYVILNHKNGYETLYGHMSQIYVKTGQVLEKGEKLGYMGSTGDSTGVHLHFEVIKNGSVDNPLKYLNK